MHLISVMIVDHRYQSIPANHEEFYMEQPSTSRDTKSGHLVTGMFSDRESAERAYAGATSRGYGNDDVDLVMSDKTRDRYFGSDSKQQETVLGTKAAQGAGVGGAIGGAV